jgi:hypothetical protein
LALALGESALRLELVVLRAEILEAAALEELPHY